LHRTPDADAEHRCDGQARRAFSKAYVQSPICGPSRMSSYTGRYMRSHGSHWNGWPLWVSEPRSAIISRTSACAMLVGKTHMTPDIEGLKSLGIAPDSVIGVRVGMRLRAL
jgi:arylsulfatase A-like enzyme